LRKGILYVKSFTAKEKVSTFIWRMQDIDHYKSYYLFRHENKQYFMSNEDD